jgi:chemotaxis protein methyltransferase CheR
MAVSCASFSGGDKESPGRRGDFSDRDFARFSDLVREQCGINLGAHKKNMLEARLRKRLRRLGIDTFSEYAEYVFSEAGRDQELISLLDVVTTNKTEFFREPAHFQFLLNGCLDRLVAGCGAGRSRPLQVWSAGCSTGEEPYTLAMVLSEYAEQDGNFDFSILGTDLSTQVLDKARLAVYPRERIETVPEPLRKKYLLRSKDLERSRIRVVPGLRRRVTFQRLNFKEAGWKIPRQIDLLFCRNVLIYFDRPTQFALLERFCSCLAPGRLLFLGHSESLHGLGLPLTPLAPSIYRRD